MGAAVARGVSAPGRIPAGLRRAVDREGAIRSRPPFSFVDERLRERLEVHACLIAG
jgi:hypothetical protein